MAANPALFLAGAKSRLLPPSIPFRFFGAAAVFQLLAWLALLAGAGAVPGFAGGLGWPLAALHGITLGVLVMSAIGASLQLLPVATRQPIRSTRGPALVWWLYTPGVALVMLGMGQREPWLLGTGAAAVVLALIVFSALLALNLRGARGMPAVVWHGWVAWACLWVVLTTALAMAWLYLGVTTWPRDILLPLHLLAASFGFMGMLAMGLSYILVPMFMLAPTPSTRQALASGGLATAALLLGAAGLVWRAQALQLAALATGAGAVALHLGLMRRALAQGLRREGGLSSKLWIVAWVCLPAGLLAILARLLGLPWPGLVTMIGLLLVGGWLLSYVLGILYRVLPFLASMHAARGQPRPPTPSALAAQRPLEMHFAAHLTALALLALAIVAGQAWLAALAAVVGAGGAAAFLAFYVILMRRLKAPAGPRP